MHDLGAGREKPISWSSPRGLEVERPSQSDSSGSSGVPNYSFMTRWVDGMPSSKREPR
jgi:hypothetical protein